MIQDSDLVENDNDALKSPRKSGPLLLSQQVKLGEQKVSKPTMAEILKGVKSGDEPNIEKRDVLDDQKSKLIQVGSIQ